MIALEAADGGNSNSSNRRQQQLLLELQKLEYPSLLVLVMFLLRRLRYSKVEILGRRWLRGRTRIGGADIAATVESPAASALMLVQVKRYSRDVSRRFVDELRGAMLRLNASQGLMITTGSFAAEAQRAAREFSGRPITLLDGPALARLMDSSGLGVTNVDGVPMVDVQFFSSLPWLTLGYQAQGFRSERKDAVRQPDREWRGFYRRSLLTTHWPLYVSAGLSSLLVVPGLDLHSAPPAAVGAIFGSLVPFLDNFWVRFDRNLWELAKQKPYLLHRQEVFHSAYLLGICVVAAVVLLVSIGTYIGVGVTLGLLSHQLIDALRAHGLRFGYPRRNRFFVLPYGLRIKSDSAAMRALWSIALALALAWLIRIGWAVGGSW